MKRRLLAAGIVLASFALMGSACSPEPPDVPVSDQNGYQIDDNDMSTFTATLPSGRVVECIAITWHGVGIECWDVPR